jgi:hypothetical protein
VHELDRLAVRLSVVFTYLWWAWEGREPEPEEIPVEGVEAAVTFLKTYVLPMARRTLAENALSPAERDAKRLLLWLRENRDRLIETVDGRMLTNAYELRRSERGPGIRQAKAMRAALAVLKEAGWVRDARMKTGGRPRDDFEINPGLWS